MPETLIIAPYAALLGLLFFALSVRVLRKRRELQIGVGDGGNPELLRRMRVHANFGEYVPISLLLILLLELSGGAPVLIHAFAAALLVGRVVHAYGVSQMRENLAFRIVGMGLTFLALLGSAGMLLFNALR